MINKINIFFLFINTKIYIRAVKELKKNKISLNYCTDAPNIKCFHKM